MSRRWKFWGGGFFLEGVIGYDRELKFGVVGLVIR